MAGLEKLPSELNEVSKLLCRLLDIGGYSQDMIEIRRNSYMFTPDSPYIFAGSKAEGLSKFYESDIDGIIYETCTICVNDRSLIDLNVCTPHQVVLGTRNVHPGYCILEVLKNVTEYPKRYYDRRVLNSLVEFCGKKVVSSILYSTPDDLVEFDPLNGPPTINGPACTRWTEYGYNDTVHTLACECTQLMQQFIQRQRQYNWPRSDVLQFIQNKRECANLVATGKAGSDTENIEFRYCFNEIELLLVKSLNETQTKLYKVLKMINTDILKKKGFTLTSFIMKNVVFWSVESNPQDSFQPDSLFPWVLEGLKMLQHVVDQNELKYFMIPDRNLFTEKVKEADRERLKAALTELIGEGPRMLLNCRTISTLITLTSDEWTLFQGKLRELELFAMDSRLFLKTRILEENPSVPMLLSG